MASSRDAQIEKAWIPDRLGLQRRRPQLRHRVLRPREGAGPSGLRGRGPRPFSKEAAL